MRSVQAMRYSGFLAFMLIVCYQGLAQENSPFSRYGIGDLYPTQSIASRSMGGLAAGYYHEQAINSVNPSSYSALKYIKLYGGAKSALVSYDIGISIDNRNLRSADPVNAYRSANFIPSYIQLGIPLSAKADTKKRNVGLVFGIKPVSRINYNIIKAERTPIDSMQTAFEGRGGLNQFYGGVGKRFGNLSIGFNAGYAWGSRDIATQVSFVNDTVRYYKSNSAERVDIWGVFLSPGFSYNFKLAEIKKPLNTYTEAYFLRIGGSGTFEQELKASTDTIRETFDYDPTTGISRVDSVHTVEGIKGTVNVPMTYNVGFLLTKKLMGSSESGVTKWSIGVDYSAGRWTDFRFYGRSSDRVIDNYMLRVGGEFVPSLFSNKLLSRTIYRVGLYTGKDYINADGNQYKVRALTFGFGFNLKKWSNYDNQSTFINTAFEIGKRGSDVNNVTENFFKLSVGFSLSDLWFSKRRYD